MVRRLWRMTAFLVSSLVYCSGVQLWSLTKSGADELRFRARAQHLGARWLCFLLGLSVEKRGNWDSVPGALVVSNHLGGLDPLALGSSQPSAFVANKKMSHWPIIGWVARQMGVFFVDRGRAREANMLVERMQRRLKAGVPVVAFPEGTTTHGDTILPFKTGVFEPVAQEGGHVVPVFLKLTSVSGHEGDPPQKIISWAGGEESFASYGWRLLGLQDATITVRAGTPIPSKNSDRKELAHAARAAVRELAEA